MPGASATVVGDSLLDVRTPSLCVDLSALEANAAACARALQRAGGAPVGGVGPAVLARFHFKAHKSSALHARAVAAACAAVPGVVAGACAQKVCEVEALLGAGEADVLLSNEVAGPRAAAALAAAAAAHPAARVAACVDSAAGAALLGRAAAAAGVTLDVLVEIDVGQRRCGVVGPAAAAALAAAVAATPGLRLRGLQAYRGDAQHLRSAAARAAAVAAVVAAAAAARDAIRAAGLPCDVVSGGGSGTFELEAASGIYTEVQPGSLLLGDADYARNRGEDGGERWLAPYAPALFLLTTVMSVREAAAGAAAGWVVLDSGLKAQSVDSGPPVCVCAAADYHTGAGGALPLRMAQRPPADAASDASAGLFASAWGHLVVKGVSDEHTTLVAAPAPCAACRLPACAAAHAHAAAAAPCPVAAPLPALGTVLLCMLGHVDPSCNLHDELIGFRSGNPPRVEALMAVDARGPGW